MQQLATKPDVRSVTLRPPYRFESPFGGEGFVLLLHSDDRQAPNETQAALAEQIVASGCRYVCCSGVACSDWHDAVDWAFIATDPNYDPPDERFIMTTWHERESVSDVVWFALNNTWFDDFVPERFLFVLLSPEPERAEEFAAAVSAG
jgi:hypothetical protein